MPRRWIPLCVGFLGTGAGVSAVIGPLVRGALTDHFSWRSVLWFLVVYTVLCIPLFVSVVPETWYAQDSGSTCSAHCCSVWVSQPC
ncbi:MFS transporter [Streptomyces sp. NPDC023723]|uniref:MFS transporter n=1 Tax=Streptomyces sp. NPDC023723 TaxID=3154323 RepID=UPI0033FE6C62